MKQNFLLVHVHYVKAQLCIRVVLAGQLEEKPVAVPFCVEVRAQITIELIVRHLHHQIEIATLELTVKNEMGT